jgi:DNA primase
MRPGHVSLWFAAGHCADMATASDAALMPQVLQHYRLVAPLIEASFAETPVVFVNYPGGLDKDGVYHATCVPLRANKLLWLIHAEYAIEFYTWAPTLLDVDKLRFGRILLEAPPGVAFEHVKLAALMMRALLFDVAKLEAVPLLDGGTGIALWVPFADTPKAPELRAWLHALCKRAAALHPELVSTGFNTHHDDRVHLHVSSNAAYHYSAVPYSLRAQGLTVCTPVRWTALGSFAGADAFRFDAIAARLVAAGDVFASEVKLIAAQRFASAPAVTA